MLIVSMHVVENASKEFLLIAIVGISISIYTMNKKKKQLKKR